MTIYSTADQEEEILIGKIINEKSKQTRNTKQELHLT